MVLRRDDKDLREQMRVRKERRERWKRDAGLEKGGGKERARHQGREGALSCSEK